MEYQHLTKKERRVLKKQIKEQEHVDENHRRKIKNIAIIFLPLILIAGGIIFVINYSPKESTTRKLSFNEAVGMKTPDFSLENIDGQTIKLSDYKGKNVILFFNEGEMCYPACWDQITALAKDEKFNTDEVEAFSIVTDQKNVWQKITSEVPELSKAKILFDPTKTVSSAYDVLSLKSSMHPGSYPGHTYFIIDKEGIIRYVYDDPNMAIRNDLLLIELSKLGEV